MAQALSRAPQQWLLLATKLIALKTTNDNVLAELGNLP
jgi:hypothetical protein